MTLKGRFKIMLKILIVDDSGGWRNFHKEAIEKIFDKEEIIIKTAESARSGYNEILFAAKEPFDLIVTDLQMESDFSPMIAGEWLVRQIQNFTQYKNSKILIVSAMYNIDMTAELLGVESLSKRLLLSGSGLPFKLKLEEMGYNISNKEKE